MKKQNHIQSGLEQDHNIKVSGGQAGQTVKSKRSWTSPEILEEEIRKTQSDPPPFLPGAPDQAS